MSEANDVRAERERIAEHIWDTNRIAVARVDLDYTQINWSGARASYKAGCYAIADFILTDRAAHLRDAEARVAVLRRTLAGLMTGPDNGKDYMAALEVITNTAAAAAAHDARIRREAILEATRHARSAIQRITSNAQYWKGRDDAADAVETLAGAESPPPASGGAEEGGAEKRESAAHSSVGRAAETETPSQAEYGKQVAGSSPAAPAPPSTAVAAGDSPTWPWVRAFAREMEAKLDENRHKGNREGWRNDAPSALLTRLRQEVEELASVLPRPLTVRSADDSAYAAGSSRQIVGECADVANFAMMIADVAGSGRLAAAPTRADDALPIAQCPKCGAAILPGAHDSSCYDFAASPPIPPSEPTHEPKPPRVSGPTMWTVLGAADAVLALLPKRALGETVTVRDHEGNESKVLLGHMASNTRVAIAKFLSTASWGTAAPSGPTPQPPEPANNDGPGPEVSAGSDGTVTRLREALANAPNPWPEGEWDEWDDTYSNWWRGARTAALEAEPAAVLERRKLAADVIEKARNFIDARADEELTARANLSAVLGRLDAADRDAL